MSTDEEPTMRDQTVVQTMCLWEWVSPHYARGSLKARTVSEFTWQYGGLEGRREERKNIGRKEKQEGGRIGRKERRKEG